MERERPATTPALQRALLALVVVATAASYAGALHVVRARGRVCGAQAPPRPVCEPGRVSDRDLREDEAARRGSPLS